MTKRRILLGLIGANITRSLAPALFADAFAAAAIDGFYHPMDVDRLPGRRLPQLLDAINTAGFAGANITYPFKQDVLALLDTVDPEAAKVGAVNTVTIAPACRPLAPRAAPSAANSTRAVLASASHGPPRLQQHGRRSHWRQERIQVNAWRVRTQLRLIFPCRLLNLRLTSLHQ